jgi:c-di-GMP-related signal transduction protein
MDKAEKSSLTGKIRTPVKKDEPSLPDSNTEKLYLGRQPILDKNKNVVAFELLFRSNQADNSADYQCDSKATVSVINHVFNELGMEAVLGSCIGLINVTQPMLADDIIELLPKSKIAFEILETVEITDEIIERCRQLKALGYKLVLDDVTNLGGKQSSVLKYIDIVKIDILQLSRNEIYCLAGDLKYLNPDITLLAEKVETIEQFEHCLYIGFDLFQGYFFAKPQIIAGRRLSHSELSLFKLLELVISDADLRTIEKSLKENTALSINLLKIANSAAIGSQRVISSIRDAVAILGRRQLQRWIQLLLYANTGDRNKLSPLLLLAASRGRAMELVAKAKKETGFEDNAFLTGIMSLIDTLLGITIEEVIASIKINKDVSDALPKREGDLGRLLRLIEYVEQDNEDELESGILCFPYLTLPGLKTIHADSILWANAICQGNA